MTETFKDSGGEAGKDVKEITDATLAKFAPGWSRFVGPIENEFSPTRPEVEATLRAMMGHALKMAREERGENDE